MADKDVIKTLLTENEKTPVTISGRSFSVGKLTIRQFFGIIDWFFDVSKQGDKRFKEINTEGETITEDVSAIMKILSDKEIAKFSGILLDEKDIKFCENEVGIDDFINIITIKMSRTNLIDLKKNLYAILEMLKKMGLIGQKEQK